MQPLPAPDAGPARAATDAHRKLELEIENLRAQLASATRELAAARRAADAANEAKDRFLSTISHELRTPLSAIVLWTSLIEDQKIAEPAQLREALEAIKRSAEEQRELIECLVDASRLTSGKLRLERKEIAIAAVVHNGIDDARDVAREKGVELIENTDANPGTFQGDARRLQQVISHLVHNAVKFTPPSGRVTIDLRRIGSEIQIAVADTGSGIDRELLTRVFDSFVQAEQAGSRLERGLGLGLTIARQIVELHGGSIVAHSEGAGRGATFIVRLPAPVAQTEVGVAEGSQHHLTNLLQGRHVLLIEDVPATRRALMAVLQEAGADVDAVDSAPAAWEIFERQRPDLILSDLGLPGIDGYALLRRIREMETQAAAPFIPALAVTAFAGDNVRDKALSSGFQSLLTKPLEPLLLVSTLVSLGSPAG
jgi:signal transduction histidine kinase